MIWKLSMSSGYFPDHQKTSQAICKLSRHILEMTVIQRVDFIVTCKNFPDAQKLSGWQCQPANQVFLPLHYHHCHCHRHHHHHRGRIVQNIGCLLVVGVIDVQAAKNEEEDPD